MSSFITPLTITQLYPLPTFIENVPFVCTFIYLQLFLEWVILQLIHKEFELVSMIQIITITQKENQNIEDHSGENLYFNLQIEGVKKTWRVNPLIPKKE